jgi:methionine aminopeptidase
MRSQLVAWSEEDWLEFLYFLSQTFSFVSDVCTKYQEASKIVNLALTGLVSQCVAGAKIIDLCQFGTTVLDAQLSKLYNKKVDGSTVDKGVAFPVCISVNEIICNHSPLPSEELVS